MPAVEVRELKVAYGEKVAVDAVSFEVEKGEVVALVGPNGAGKTTTVEVLEGFRQRDSGEVRVLGLDPAKASRQLAGRIGVVLQNGGAYPVMSPARLLKLFSSYYDDARDPESLIEVLGLAGVSSTPFKRLSGGEQQRVLLALALVGNPEVCFLDEPTAGVDPAGRLVVRDVIAALRRDEVAVIVTSHELDEVEKTADRVVIIDEGRLLAAGRSEELGEKEEVRFSVEGAFDVAALSAALGVEVLEQAPSRYRAASGTSPQLVARLTAWLAENDLVLADLRVGRESLEDVFFRLVGSKDKR